MQYNNIFRQEDSRGISNILGVGLSQKSVVGFILLTALIAFEIFNFDTTRYALQDLLGGVSFWGIGWASILAIAFCAIDFAGLARLFTPEKGKDEPKAVWYLMGAWLLGATMNAVMTWWAVSLTLLSHNLGNEVLSRDQLLQIVPIFVAVLVWLTRILFIGAFSVAGEHIFEPPGKSVARQPQSVPSVSASAVRMPVNRPQPTAASPTPTMPKRAPVQNKRIRQRPPVPGSIQQAPVGMQARSKQQ